MNSGQQSCTDRYQTNCQTNVLQAAILQALLEQNRLMEELMAESHATGKKLRCLEARSDLYAGCLRDEDRQREIRKEMERSDRRGTI